MRLADSALGFFRSPDHDLCVPGRRILRPWEPCYHIEIGPKRPSAKTTHLPRPKPPTPKIGRNDPEPSDPRLPLMQALYIVDSKLLLLCYDYQSFKVVTEVPKSVLTQLFLNTKKNTYEVLNQLAAHY